jgi:hypothetical protein
MCIFLSFILSTITDSGGVAQIILPCFHSFAHATMEMKEYTKKAN